VVGELVIGVRSVALGLLDRWFSRRLTPERFARLVLARLRRAGADPASRFDAERFAIIEPGGAVFNLGNVYAVYQAASATDREKLMRSFLATWAQCGRYEPPEDLNDARMDLLPVLRSRAYFECDVPLMSESLEEGPQLVYQTLNDHLAAGVVYDLPQSTMSVGPEQLGKWGITFYEALEIAKQNLAQKGGQYAKLGGLAIFMEGDAYDAARMVVPEIIERLQLGGRPVAIAPHRERLFVASEDDAEALEAMAKLVADEVELPRAVSGQAFVWDGAEWSEWLPPEGSPLYGAFHNLAQHTLLGDYANQKDLFDKRLERRGEGPYAPSLMTVENQATGEVGSMTVWPPSNDVWLPRADRVAVPCALSPDDPSTANLAAPAIVPWSAVLDVMGDALEPQDVYPPRWRAASPPTPEQLARLAERAEGP
jgi:hypothetical protein